MTFVINEATRMCCGRPVANCNCGQPGAEDFRRSAGQTYPRAQRQEPLGIPVMNFDDNGQSAVTNSYAMPQIVRNDNGGTCLGIPVLNFKSVASSQGYERTGNRRSDGKQTPLGIPVMEF